MDIVAAGEENNFYELVIRARIALYFWLATNCVSIGYFNAITVIIMAAILAP